ncbi:zinc-binding dehydrogenase [Kribbella sandramycini]|uniref:enoyl-[acyl-carrier-protein] reductase n=1 Tax=Kribbella sandramycini TaxID=60450 RepID=A0A7Y4P1J6_9ACTN|nr:zinc-binding dehydrogenase [Kribbella sandramycini]MBB6570617.1 NADPH:quinone reductase-like Zn-dependent oxidoreductase [Kribbella sandramycini]NOL43761.1 zinc-binding dehydrogenase [Kribbella sandramycini]
MKVVLKELGDLAANAELQDTAELIAGPDDVVVAIEAATVNPVDQMLASGNYNYPVRTPYDLGTEGVGRVVAGASKLIGRRVLILPNYEQGTWADKVVVKAANVVPIPEGGDVEQMAMLSTNPLTAYLALTRFTGLQPGDWVGLNLGNSAVAQYATALAQRAGARVLSVVRRPDAADGLAADVVLVDGDDLADRIKAELGDDRFALILDGAGDASVGALAQAAAFGAPVVVYSSVTGAAPAVGLGDLVFTELRVHGVWIPNWLRTASAAEIEQTYGDLARLTIDGVLRARVEATYALADVAQAIEHAARPGRGGKVLLRP